MGDLFWLSKQQLARIEPYFPLAHGVPRVDDRKVVSGIIFVIRNGLRWRDAPREYGRIKPFTIGSSGGADWVFSTIYSARYLPKVEALIP